MSPGRASRQSFPHLLFLLVDHFPQFLEIVFGTYFNDQGHRGFTVNGEPVLIRGGGWVDDVLLSDTTAKIDAQLAYVKQMHLNTIRLEGFWGSSHYLYDAADREGILVMPGWSCQWEWENYVGKPVSEEYGGVLEPEEMDLVAASLAGCVRSAARAAGLAPVVALRNE